MNQILVLLALILPMTSWACEECYRYISDECCAREDDVKDSWSTPYLFYSEGAYHEASKIKRIMEINHPEYSQYTNSNLY